MIIEKDSRFRRTLSSHIGLGNFVVLGVDRKETAVALLRENRVDLALLGLNSLGDSGVAILDTMLEIHPDLPVIVINTPQQLPLSIACMRRGVLDDFLVPIDIDALVARIRDAAPGAVPVSGEKGAERRSGRFFERGNRGTIR